MRVPPCFDARFGTLHRAQALTDTHLPSLHRVPPLPYCRFVLTSTSRRLFSIPLTFYSHTVCILFLFLDVILSLTFILSFHICQDRPLIPLGLSTYTHSLQRTVALQPTNTRNSFFHPLNPFVSIQPTIVSIDYVLHRSAQPLNSTPRQFENLVRSALEAFRSL